MTDSAGKYEWFSDWFDSPYYHLLYFHRDDSEARRFIDNVIAYLDLPSTSHILDLACGRGRHARYLHSLGFSVTGLDLSPRNIEVAQKTATTGLQFFTHDMRDPIPGAYDAVLNLFTSFGYFSTKAEHEKALANISNALRPGGSFVMDYLNTNYIRENLITHNWESVEGVEFELIRRIHGQYIEKDIRITDGQTVKFYQEKVRAFTRDELVELLEGAGFTVKEIWGSYDLQPFDLQDSPRLVAMCEKTP